MKRCQALRVQPSYILAGTRPGISRKRPARYLAFSSRVSGVLFQPGHLGHQQSALELRHAEVGGPRRGIGEVKAVDLPRPAVVVEGVDFFGQVAVVGQHGAAFAGAEVLRHLEAEAAGRAPGADAAAAPLGQVGLAGVLDHRQIVFLGHLQDGVHVRYAAADVYGHDGRRAVGDGRLDLLGIDQERFRVDVDEDRQGEVRHDRGHAGDEGVGRDDDLVARSDAQGPQGGDQGGGAAAGGDAVFRPGQTRVGRFKGVHVGGAAAEPLAAAECGQHGLLLPRVGDRPLGKRP